MAFLLPNLKNKNNIYMFISTKFMTKLIRTVSKKQNDEDYISHYINFLKYLSTHLNKTSIYFFYHKETFSFPLLDSCITLYNHYDPLVKNVSRHIVLTILKTNNQEIIHYLCSNPYITLFLLIIKQTKVNLKKLVSNPNINEEEKTALLEEVQNDIIFIQDIFNIGIEKINYVLINGLFGELIIPFILHNLRTEIQTYNINSIYTIEICLYVLWLFFYYIKNSSFLNILCILLFNDKIVKAVTSEIELEIETDKIIEIFEKELDPNGSFEYFLMRNYSNSIVQLLGLDDYNEILQVHNNLEFYDFIKSIQTIKQYYKHNHSEFLKVIYNEITNKLATRRKDFSKIKRVHNILAKLTGLVVGMSDQNTYVYSAIHLMKQQFPQYKTNGIVNEVKLKFVDILCNSQLYSTNTVMYLSLILFQIAKKEEGCIDEDLLIDLGFKKLIIDNSAVVDINGFYDINSMDFDYSTVNFNGNSNKGTIKKDELFNYVYFKGTLLKQEKIIQDFLLNSLAQNPFYFSPFTLNIIYQSLFDFSFDDEAIKLMYLKKTFNEIIKNIQNELSNKQKNSSIYKYTLPMFKLEFMKYQSDVTTHLTKLTSNPIFIVNIANHEEQLKKQLIYPPYIQELFNYRTLLYHLFTYCNKFNQRLLFDIKNDVMIDYEIKYGDSIKLEDLVKENVVIFDVNVCKINNDSQSNTNIKENMRLYVYNFHLCFAKTTMDQIYLIQYCYPIWNVEIKLKKDKIEINALIDINDMKKKDVFIITSNETTQTNHKKMSTTLQMINNQISNENDKQYNLIKGLFDKIN